MDGGGGGGGGGAADESLPLGVASVLWELECCAAQARVTLMNLSEGRPNHFGVFRAHMYVQETRLLEEKVMGRFVGTVRSCASDQKHRGMFGRRDDVAQARDRIRTIQKKKPRLTFIFSSF